MNIQPLNLTDLLRVVTWPANAALASTVLRRPFGELVSIFDASSLDLAGVAETKQLSLKTGIPTTRDGV